MPKVILSSKVVISWKCPLGMRKVDLFDVKTKGLMLEVREGGGRTYYLRYQNERGKTRQMRLADAKDVSLLQARALADKARNKIAMGNDPLEDKAILRRVPRFSDFVHDQYIPYIKTYKRSWECDVSLLKNHLLPQFSNNYLDEIERSSVIQLITSLTAKGYAPATVNRILILSRYIYNLAIRWETHGVTSNPFKRVPLLDENNQRQRFLIPEEIKSLIRAMSISQNKLLKPIVLMLLLTGCRKREVLDSKWEDFNFEQRYWRIPITKSGKSRTVPLSVGAEWILSTLPREPGQPWLFVNDKTGKPFTTIYFSWDTARKTAGLSEVRMHDLRHSFASLLVNTGRSLYEVQHLLGHSQVKTTQRYAHLSQDRLLDAANSVAATLKGALAELLPGN